ASTAAPSPPVGLPTTQRPGTPVSLGTPADRPGGGEDAGSGPPGAGGSEAGGESAGAGPPGPSAAGQDAPGAAPGGPAAPAATPPAPPGESRPGTLAMAQPRYPGDAEQAGLEGTVVLLVT